MQELLERVRGRSQGDENMADRFSACESNIVNIVTIVNIVIILHESQHHRIVS